MNFMLPGSEGVMHTSPPAPPVLDAHRTRPVLAVVALSLMAVVSAVSGLNIALPSLARDIGATQTELTWIVDAYTVVFAGLLLFAGALGDRFGRKRLLLGGLLLRHFFWGSVFLVNVPVCVLAIVTGLALVPTSRDASGAPLDPAGADDGVASSSSFELPLGLWAGKDGTVYVVDGAGDLRANPPRQGIQPA
jgi:MFS family permease